MSLTDQQAKELFLQKVAHDTAQEKMQAMQTQMMFQSLHMQTAKDIYVDSVRYAVALASGQHDLIDDARLEEIASQSKRAADRFMVGIGAWKLAAPTEQAE